MGLFTGSLENEMDTAQEDYVKSVQDIADTKTQMANDIDYTQTNQETYDYVNDLARREAEQNAARQQEINTLSNNTSRMSNAIDTTENTNRVNIQNQKFKEEQQRYQQQRDERNKQIIAAKQLASEEAKMKYELATQKYNQAKTNWTNAFKTLQALGCAVSVIPGLQWVGVATTGVATVGAAIA